jgi:heme/copper-type cytochrome/quinol oxidase subunit 4
MKLINGIISVLLGLVALYLMFIEAKTDMEFVTGFLVMMASIIFLLFMMMEERNEEISKLRQIVMKMKNIN